jgi:hypothetical protein
LQEKRRARMSSLMLGRRCCNHRAATRRGCAPKVLYIGDPLESEAIVLQDGWCLKSTDRKGATMTTDHRRVDVHMAQEVLLDDAGFLREIVERVLQEVLEAEHRAWPLVTSFILSHIYLAPQHLLLTSSNLQPVTV